MDTNIQQLVDEIYKRDGISAVELYLSTHTDLTKEEIQEEIDYLRPISSAPPTKSEDSETFLHFCMKCVQEWIGADGTMCPLCGTDGVISDDKIEIKDMIPKIENKVNTILMKMKHSILG